MEDDATRALEKVDEAIALDAILGRPWTEVVLVNLQERSRRQQSCENSRSSKGKNNSPGDGNGVDLDLTQTGISSRRTDTRNEEAKRRSRDRGRQIEVIRRSIVGEGTDRNERTIGERDVGGSDLISGVGSIEEDELVERDGRVPGEVEPSSDTLAVRGPFLLVVSRTVVLVSGHPAVDGMPRALSVSRRRSGRSRDVERKVGSASSSSRSTEPRVDGRSRVRLDGRIDGLTSSEENVVLSSIVRETPRRVVTSAVVVSDPGNVRGVVVGVDGTFRSSRARGRVVLAEDGVGRRSDRSRVNRRPGDRAVETGLVVVGSSVVGKPVPRTDAVRSGALGHLGRNLESRLFLADAVLVRREDD